MRVAVRGEAWNEITSAVSHLCSAIKQALDLHLDELVVEIILFNARGHTQWWLTQVKAFKSTKLDDRSRRSLTWLSSSTRRAVWATNWNT